MKSARRALIGTQLAPELEHPSQTVRLSPPRRRSSSSPGTAGPAGGGITGAAAEAPGAHSDVVSKTQRARGGEGGGLRGSEIYSSSPLLLQ